MGLFARHSGRRCKTTSTLFSRRRGRRCRPVVRIPRFAFPIVFAALMATGCASGVSTPTPSPQMPPPAYGESSYVPYQPDSVTSANQLTSGAADTMWTTDPGVTSATLMLVLLGMWHISPALGACFVDWLRDRRPRRIEVYRR